MLADIVKGTDHAICAANDGYRLPCDLVRQEVPRLWQVADMPDIAPRPPENGGKLLLMDGGVGVIAARKHH
jgi:hypothetical protein